MHGSWMAVVGLLLVVSTARGADPYGGIDPYWMLLHEPAVIAELKLSEPQRKAYRSALDGLDLQFFPLRNKSQKEGTAGLDKIMAAAREQLGKLLSREQAGRIQEILTFKLGSAAFRRDDFAARLKLSDKQRGDIEKILDEVQASVTAIEKEAASGKPREPLEKKFNELRTDEQKRILALLTPAQRTAWKDALGRPFDLAKLGQPLLKAPELIDSGEWINAKVPQQLGQQRGKVVVIHFYAAGCINCIHNYPTYREWQEKWKGSEVVLLGIHTPETSAERDLASVRQKAAAEKFAFPVLIDAQSANWNAWGNSMWPSVYVVDKQGYLRNFWPGELKWQGATGDEFIAKRVEALLGEK